MSPILLDTHAALWSSYGKISASAASTIEAAKNSGGLLLSPISAWEIGILAKKRRLSLEAPLQDFISALFSRSGALTAALTPAIAAASTLLPDDVGNDPADRIIIATAAAYGAALVTRDAQIHRFAKTTKYIRCIAC
jgi:PIN domain nuclease of toxin-antitoxin system